MHSINTLFVFSIFNSLLELNSNVTIVKSSIPAVPDQMLISAPKN